MRKVSIKLIFFLYVFASCHLPPNNESLKKTLLKEGYKREFGSKFNFFPERNDSIEENYHRKFAVKYAKAKNRPSFFDYPPIKDSINFTIKFEQLKTGLCKDTIDIYINNKLLISGEHPSKPACRRYYPELPKYAEGTFINKTKRKEASVMVVFHNEKVLFDTIVPLRFKEIIIGRPGYDFFINFEKALH